MSLHFLRQPQHYIFIAIFSLLAASNAFSQDSTQIDLTLPEGVSLSNQLQYNYKVNTKTEVLENWFNFDYRYGIFSAGFRFDTFQPNDSTVAGGRFNFSDVAFKYIKVDAGNANFGGEVSAGNYYVMFGRGLLLKIYEERSLRVDNNLLGVKFIGRYNGLTLKALSGSVEDNNSPTPRRIDLLHGADAEYKFDRKFKAGVSYVGFQPDDATKAQRSRLASVRIQPSVWNFDFYGEYGIRRDEQTLAGTEKTNGQAAYGSMGFYYGTFSLTSEIKYYDNFSLKSSNGAVAYNTPPALRRDYSYTLLNRHPSPLDPNNEQGFQVESNYQLGSIATFNASYGLTKTLPASSYFKKASPNLEQTSRTQLQEFFAEAVRTWSDKLTTSFVFGYNKEYETNTKNLTPILGVRYDLDETNTLHAIFEHQHTTKLDTQEQYDDDLLTIEYLRSPKLSVGFAGEMQTTEPTKGNIERRFWGYVEFGYKIANHTDASLLVGTRQAGYNCIGGVCLFKPELRGIELKLLTRF